jgi:hypothetical protein
MVIWYTYFTVIWYVSSRFGIFYDYLVYFYPFWYVVTRKIWHPCAAGQNQSICFSRLKNGFFRNAPFRAKKYLPLPVRRQDNLKAGLPDFA